ncbi:hypothetical protein CR513_37965, partial [Mucuna pruriens]
MAMAKPKNSLYLCCFGRKSPTDHSTISEHNTKQKSPSTNWFPWQRIIRLRVKNSIAKTVPLEFDETEKLKLKFKGKAHSSRWRWKSKSELLNNTTKSKSQQYRGNNVEDDTREQSKSHAVSLPSSKRQVRRLLSSTTLKHGKRKQVERYNRVVGASVIMMILISLIVWGRLCSILCTSAWLYLVPSFSRQLKTTNTIIHSLLVSKRKLITIHFNYKLQ